MTDVIRGTLSERFLVLRRRGVNMGVGNFNYSAKPGGNKMGDGKMKGSMGKGKMGSYTMGKKTGGSKKGSY